jgi:hypothetical protein
MSTSVRTSSPVRDVVPPALAWLLVVAAGALGAVSVAIWVPMVLAVAWASGQHWDVPALSIPDMARTHGLVNALAFVLCGLVGGQIARPAADPAVGVGS